MSYKPDYGVCLEKPPDNQNHLDGNFAERCFSLDAEDNPKGLRSTENEDLDANETNETQRAREKERFNQSISEI